MYCLQTKRVGLALRGLVLVLAAWPLLAWEVPEQGAQDQDNKDEAVVTAAPSIPTRVTVSVTEEEARANPPTFKVRMQVLGQNMRGFQAFYETVPGTLFDHARNFPKDWGRGFPGLGKRFGNQYGQFLVGQVFESGVAALHHEDPRYFYSHAETRKARLGHALVMTVMNETSDGSGHKRVALSRFAGVYGSWAVAQQWSPDSVQSFRSFLLWGSVGMAFKAGSNVAREFWPDVRRKYFKKWEQRERDRTNPPAPAIKSVPEKRAPEKILEKPATASAPTVFSTPETHVVTGEASFEHAAAGPLVR